MNDNEDEQAGVYNPPQIEFLIKIENDNLRVKVERSDADYYDIEE